VGDRSLSGIFGRAPSRDRPDRANEIDGEVHLVWFGRKKSAEQYSPCRPSLMLMQHFGSRSVLLFHHMEPRQTQIDRKSDVSEMI
jgi:hypothetical protein